MSSGGSVTDSDSFSGNYRVYVTAMEGLPPSYEPPETDPEVCHWCRTAFRPPTSLRFPILTEVRFGSGWERVSICADCFKRDVSWDEATRQERYARDCRGCGEPLKTPLYGRFRWHVCSSRCYQRALRKDKRSFMNCEVCKKTFHPARAGARFCSNACRQWAYRQRKRTA